MKHILSWGLALSLFCCPSAHARGYRVSDWAKQEFALAVEHGILSDTALFSDYTDQISRRDTCRFLVRAFEKLTGQNCSEKDAADLFSDTDDPYVLIAYKLGIVAGTGRSLFEPERTITRQEFAVMLSHLIANCGFDVGVTDYQTGLCFEAIKDADEISDWARGAAAQMLVRGYMVGTADNAFSPLLPLTAEQAVILAMRAYAKNTGGLMPDDEDGLLPDEDFYVWNGKYKDNDPSEVFVEGEITAEAFALTQMTDIVIDVWQIGADGEKAPAKLTVTVNKYVADKFKAVFAEIFNGDEKFPIKSAGGYFWRAPKSNGKLSEHNYGTAVDINPNENYCLYSNGTVVGDYWMPGEDPYSIAVGGDVWNAFVKHGFTWGGDAWRSTFDYMHFSYLGT